MLKTTHKQFDEETKAVMAVLTVTAKGIENRRLRSMLKRFTDEIARIDERRVRQKMILKVVIEGYDDLDDISDRTGIPKSTVYLDLNVLSRQGLIEIRKAEPNGRRPKNRYTAK